MDSIKLKAAIQIFYIILEIILSIICLFTVYLCLFKQA